MKDYAFGNYLTKKRKACGLSQKELGKRLGVSDKAISRWENGASKPRTSLLVKLAAVLDTNIDTLMTAGKTITSGEKPKGVFSLTDIANDKQHEEHNSMAKINFIPKKAVANGNYLCTWDRQARLSKQWGLTGNACSEVRDALNEEYLFGDLSNYHLYSDEFKSGLIFLIDDGWDVPYGSVHYGNEEFYGSLLADEEKFKSFGKTPEERLINLSKKVKEMGYAGLGIWISPNYGIKDDNGVPDYDDIAAYWEEKAEMCHKADIKYWKVDWGIFMRDSKYREIMTMSCRKKAPGLKIEHAYPRGVFSDYNDPKHPMDKILPEYLEFSDYLRTYDIFEPFEYSESLKRVDLALSGRSRFRHGCKGNINVEWVHNIAAGLGFNLGIMNYNKETEAVLRWQRIAPPFSATEGDYFKSEAQLTDTHYFESEVATWFRCCRKTHIVSAPAIMTRNCKLPEVKPIGELTPFVLASKNPETGALAVATLPRTVDPNAYVKAPADVTVFPDDLSTKVGVFGFYNSLTLKFPDSIPKNAVVWAQCLLSDVAIDITDKVTIDGNSITIDSKTLRYYGKSTHDHTETYEPSLLITVTMK